MTRLGRHKTTEVIVGGETCELSWGHTFHHSAQPHVTGITHLFVHYRPVVEERALCPDLEFSKIRSIALSTYPCECGGTNRLTGGSRDVFGHPAPVI